MIVKVLGKRRADRACPLLARHRLPALIVDDQPTFHRQLRRLLSFAGLEVVGEAADIPTAEELVRSLRPDLAVVDIMLPGINGLEGTRRLKCILPDLRVFLVSAYADQASVYTASAPASRAFLAKDEIDLNRAGMERINIFLSSLLSLPKIRGEEEEDDDSSFPTWEKASSNKSRGWGKGYKHELHRKNKQGVQVILVSI
jgi:CheY-like chemotaxis protein